MRGYRIHLLFLLLFMMAGSRHLKAQPSSYQRLQQSFLQPGDSAHPWVFWYWIKAAVSKTAITADLEAMKEAGIGGAYLMPIQGAPNPIFQKPPVEQLSPEWWGMVRHAMEEADRLGIKLGMHACDGFALAGGPWITPELSMQKLVHSSYIVKGEEKNISIQLPAPPSKENYYRDIAVYAYPSPWAEENSWKIRPQVSASNGTSPQYLAQPDHSESFRSDTACWIQYSFDQPFTCRTIKIFTGGNNFQSRRLTIYVSNDGIHFQKHVQLEPPRHGWQDTDEDVTNAIPEITAKHFRFSYDPEGSEPGAEDLDAAKWKPVLKLTGIWLSAEPSVHQYEGKSGSVWRISPATSRAQLPDSFCIPQNQMLDISSFMNDSGWLTWKKPPGQWRIIRIGHTSTGHTNYTGGNGLGLECDKFNPAAVELQFNEWFGKVFEEVGAATAQKVLKVFHVDSWECGSQNWSPVFEAAFREQHGYEIKPFLPAMLGVPIENAGVTEQFLLDVRETIVALTQQNFYEVFAEKAREKGCVFSAESIAPTMTSDGMLHYGKVDLPMGEFWFRSPTHDKPNDMLDAISGAHIYGKNIVQAEAFTTLRMDWSEHPGVLKTTGDRNLALGVNKLVFHVFSHNPEPEKKPGVTLDGVGLYFQKNQTWWRHARAWMDYLKRCQALLQFGDPVTDIAVFTGDDLPRRSVSPDRLAPVLPGLFGEERIQKEKERLANKGLPMAEMPDGVRHGANISKAEDWIDPLNGYRYDSFNPDALLNLASVRNGNIVLPGGASYRTLVIPGISKMMPNGNNLRPASANKIKELARNGATIMISDDSTLLHSLFSEEELRIWQEEKSWGEGKFVPLPWTAKNLESIGIFQDVTIRSSEEREVKGMAWNHREKEGTHVYFFSNQLDEKRKIRFSLRATGNTVEKWDPLSGEMQAIAFAGNMGRTELEIEFEPNGSCFIVLSGSGNAEMEPKENSYPIRVKFSPWEIKFETAMGGPVHRVQNYDFRSWTESSNDSIRYYSGTADYRSNFRFKGKPAKQNKYFLHLDSLYNTAEVFINGQSCGIVWTYPYLMDISTRLRKGKNTIEIQVTNTWANRLIGDEQLPKAQRITETTAPFRLKDKPLLPAGLLKVPWITVKTQQDR